jgi:hypothetical protein
MILLMVAINSLIFTFTIVLRIQRVSFSANSTLCCTGKPNCGELAETTTGAAPDEQEGGLMIQ